MTSNITVIGKTGQLAKALKISAAAHGLNAKFYDRLECDLLQPENKINQFLNRTAGETDCIIIAAAYTNVDLAEGESEKAFAVNGIAPGVIAKYCERRSIPLVHISTDYVYDGENSTFYEPSHPTDPINVYGASKLAGEHAILASGCSSAILRTSWVFDGSGKNFFTTMMKLAQTKDELNVVGDQFGRPTYALHLADATLATVQKMVSAPLEFQGLYHVSGSGPVTSWADFASEIFDAARKHIPHRVTVNAISTLEYPTSASRPTFSGLDILKFEETFEFELPSWRSGIKSALQEYYQKQKRE